MVLSQILTKIGVVLISADITVVTVRRSRGIVRLTGEVRVRSRTVLLGGEICFARNGRRPGEIFPTEELNGPARDLSDKDKQGLVLDDTRHKETNGLAARRFHDPHDGFAGRSMTRHRPPDRHSSVQG